MNTQKPLEVEYFGPLSSGCGNIVWRDSHPMRAGRFPASHPCATNPSPTVAIGEQLAVIPQHGSLPPSDDGLGRFRALGYQASCFPEGDGICFIPPPAKEREQMIEDVRVSFGWKVTVKRT